VQYYRDGGTIGVEVKNASNQVFQFCLDGRINTQTPQRVYLGAMHPSVAEAVKIDKGSNSELGIIKLLRSWLKTKISANDTDPTEFNSSDDLAKERYKIFQIVYIVTLLQENFEYDPALFDPEYSCYDLHGGYQCHIKSKPAEEPKDDVFGDGKFLTDFGCNTDADCYAAKDGSCIAGVMLSNLLKDQIQQNSLKVDCRCLKGPVEYGCVPGSK
jgi:hypothetical protein